MDSNVTGGYEVVPIDFTSIFGLDASDAAILGLWVAVGSAIFTAFAFLITYSRNRKSEQIKIARETRDNINSALDRCNIFMEEKLYPEEGSHYDRYYWFNNYLNAIEDVSAPVRYFTFLVTEKEIADKSVLKYYKDSNLQTLGYLENRFADVERVTKAYDFTLTPDQASWVARDSQGLSHNRKVWEDVPTISLWKRVFLFM